MQRFLNDVSEVWTSPYQLTVMQLSAYTQCSLLSGYLKSVFFTGFSSGCHRRLRDYKS